MLNRQPRPSVKSRAPLRWVTAAAMSSDNANGTAHALVCAPCYICLEDGPDEEGKPLIRNCSCRGESSAGYHLSCIVKYAKAKTRAAVEEYEAGGDGGDCFQDHWIACANCRQGYEDSLCMELAKKMVTYVASLVSEPDTHKLHYEARSIMLTCLSKNDEEAKTVQEEITSLLRLWEERKGDFARRWNVDERELNVYHMEEKAWLLTTLGLAELAQGKKEQGFQTLELSLMTKKNVKSLIGNKKNHEESDEDTDEDDDDIDF